MRPETRVTHPPRVRPSPENPPLVEPVYHSVKFTTDLARMNRIRLGREEGFIYTRISNPTVRSLELLLAELQGREDALTFASGLAAVTVPLLALLKPGDHLIHFFESYKSSRSMIKDLLRRYGIRDTLLSIEDLAGLEAALKREPTRLVLFESPTNPVLKIADVARITALAKAHGALTVMDNTFAGFHQHGRYPVDLYVHSLTKYAGGHGDATGGVVIGSRELVSQVKRDAWHFGAALDPEVADRFSRGMKTYFLRYEKQCANALLVARALDSDPRATNVRYPGLESHPGHALARAQMKDFGAMIAFDLPGGSAAVHEFFGKLKLFILAASLGSTESLVAPGLDFYATDLSEDERATAGVTDGTVRLSIGTEAPEDLIEDLRQALGG